MTYKTFLRLLADAAECKTLDEYIAECGGSLPDEYYDDGIATGGKIARIKDTLQYIWEYARNKSFAKLYELSKYNSQTQLYLILNIPRRTVQNWLGGISNPPPYVLDTIAFAILTIRLYPEEI